MAEKWLSLNYGDVLCGYAMMDGYMEGFKAHEELVKDKLFTVEDMRKITQAAFVVMMNPETVITDFNKWFDKRIQSLFPKTEWEIEFDEQGKIKLI